MRPRRVEEDGDTVSVVITSPVLVMAAEVRRGWVWWSSARDGEVWLLLLCPIQRMWPSDRIPTYYSIQLSFFMMDL